MTFTYDVTTDRGKVRLLIGDTNSGDALLQDAEVDYFLDSAGSVNGAAIRACYAVAAKFSRMADTTVEGVSVSYSQKASSYRSLAAQIKAQSSTVIANNIVASGISVSDIDENRDDSDRVKEKFYMDRFKNPESSESLESTNE